MQYFLLLLVLIPLAFAQNMAFTFSSRSRNSGDPKYHAKAALLSNGIWFACHILIWGQIWSALTNGVWWQLIVLGAVYTASTTMGSVCQMHRMLKTEEGKRRVGAGKED